MLHDFIKTHNIHNVELHEGLGQVELDKATRIQLYYMSYESIRLYFSADIFKDLLISSDQNNYFTPQKYFIANVPRNERNKQNCGGSSMCLNQTSNSTYPLTPLHSLPSIKL